MWQKESLDTDGRTIGGGYCSRKKLYRRFRLELPFSLDSVPLEKVELSSYCADGKSFICMKSSYVDKTGVRHFDSLSHFDGDIATTPRSQCYYIATEYGIVNLEEQYMGKGKDADFSCTSGVQG